MRRWSEGWRTPRLRQLEKKHQVLQFVRLLVQGLAGGDGLLDHRDILLGRSIHPRNCVIHLLDPARLCAGRRDDLGKPVIRLQDFRSKR